MQDHYEINVGLNNVHFFATAERSITTMHECRLMYTIFKQKFPASEGYKISVTHWKAEGQILNME